jgi:hypothetical protein
MPNIFRKISRGAGNIFKKVDSGATKFFNKLPSQVNSVVSATNKGLNQGLDAVGDVARKVGNSLEKVGPALALGASIIAPEFAIPIAAGITTATALNKQVQSGARAGQAMSNQLAQQVQNKASNVIGQAQRGVQTGISNLQSQTNNALMRANAGVNNTVNQAKAGYNQAVANAGNQLTIH